MKQLNISIEDKLFNKWKDIAADKNIELVPLVRLILQNFAPDKESITIVFDNNTIKGEAEIILHHGKNGCDFWFGTICLIEQVSQVQKWLEHMDKEWRLTRKNGQFGNVKIFHIGIKTNGPSCEVVLGFSGVSKLQT
jgi:hypothetical protein